MKNERNLPSPKGRPLLNNGVQIGLRLPPCAYNPSPMTYLIPLIEPAYENAFAGGPREFLSVLSSSFSTPTEIHRVR